MKYDFSGYATKNDLKCSDGRVIRKDAFKENDGQTVPVVWQHMHNSPENVLGHALLENREEGVYAYCKFNNTDAGKNAKQLVEHGDITALSIHANKLKQRGNDVLHGSIREVSLVFAGANPEAYIDHVVLTHSDGTEYELEDEIILYSGIEFDNDNLEHADEGQNGSKTLEDVFNTLNEEQKNVVYALIAASIDGDDEEDEDDDVKHNDYEGDLYMKKNVFDEDDFAQDVEALTHSEMTEIIEDAKKTGSFRESFLEHAERYGIENIDVLFPDAKTVTPTPDFIKRDTEWVSTVLNGTKHTPFSRIKSTAADITADEARAKGYIKGNEKKEEVIKLLKRTTTPTTIYKKQKLDRDDIVDITDLDVVAWLKAEMRVMLNEEIARAALIGDGREIEDEDKINEEHIRPISKDDPMYAHPVSVPANTTGDALIESILRARPFYKGSGNPTMFTTEKVITDMLLLKDKIGRRLYNSEAELATALRVTKIVPVEVMETTPDIVAILVNLNDYVIGADKGGEVNLFDDFDIDFNQYKYLMETRISGALVHPKSALVIKKAEGDQVMPTAPTFNTTTGVLTIPNVTGAEYYIDGELAESGAQPAIESGTSIDVTVFPADGYYFPNNITVAWTYTID